MRIFSGKNNKPTARGSGEWVYTVVYSLKGLRDLTGKGRARVLFPVEFYDSADIEHFRERTQRDKDTFLDVAET